MYVCNWSRFLLRRATLLFQISCLLFVRNRIKERNCSTRGLIFFEFVRIHCSSSPLCLKKKQDEVYREGRENRLARPPSMSSGSLTSGLRLLAPGFRLVSERESPLFRFPSHPASTGSPVVQRKKGFRAKWASTSSLRQKPIEKWRGGEREREREEGGRARGNTSNMEKGWGWQEWQEMVGIGKGRERRRRWRRKKGVERGGKRNVSQDLPPNEKKETLVFDFRSAALLTGIHIYIYLFLERVVENEEMGKKKMPPRGPWGAQRRPSSPTFFSFLSFGTQLRESCTICQRVYTRERNGEETSGLYR